jgi:uncharacterized BrkB/YihY/UPF0761 family membrane protein
MTSALSFYAVVSLILGVHAFWSLTLLIGSTSEAQTSLESMLSQFLLPQSAKAVLDQTEKIFATSLLTQLGAWWGILAFLWSGCGSMSRCTRC